jgi:hypothetical protein
MMDKYVDTVENSESHLVAFWQALLATNRFTRHGIGG